MFEHFSMKQAPKINRILIWGILPILTVAYWLMYYVFSDEYKQWYTLFVSRQLEIFMLSWIAWISFRKTSEEGIATAVLIVSAMELVLELLDVNTKGSVFDVIWKCAIGVLLIYALRKYHRHARNT